MVAGLLTAATSAGVASAAAPSVSVIASIGVGGSPQGVAVDSTHHEAYVANYGGSVSVINELTQAVTDTIGGVGAAATAVAVDPSFGEVFVTSASTGSVAVIKQATDTVIGSIPVGAQPQSVAVDPMTHEVFVANLGSNSVSVISEATGAVTSTIAVGAGPYAVAVDPTVNRVYVTNASPASDSVSVISETSDTVLATIEVGGNPDALAVNPTTHDVFVADESSNAVSVIDESGDATTGTVTATIPVNTGIVGLDGVAVDPQTQAVYVSNLNTSSVSVIDESGDATSGTVTQTVGVGAQPTGLAVDSAFHYLYVTSQSSNAVTVVSPNVTGYPVTATISGAGSQPDALAVDPSTHNVYVADDVTPGTVSVIDESGGAHSGTVAATIGVGGHPDGVVVDPSTHDVYVANYDDATISVVDGSGDAHSGTVVATIPVGTAPSAVAVDPSTHAVYVTNATSQTVSVVDESGDAHSGTVVATIPVGTDPSAVAVDPSTHDVYVANQAASGSVSVIDESGDSHTGSVIATLPVNPYLNGIAVDVATHVVYVSSRTSASVFGIDESGDAQSGSVTSAVATGFAPDGVAVDPSTHHVYVADYNAVAVIDESGDLQSGTIVAKPSIAPTVSAVAVDASTGTAYTADQTANSVSVISAQPLPIVAALTQTLGATTGGTTVTIQGSGFTGETAVRFGSTPATGVTVNSDYSLTATAPAVTAAGPVTVSVTTPAGTSRSTPAGTFTYEAVPPPQTAQCPSGTCIVTAVSSDNSRVQISTTGCGITCQVSVTPVVGFLGSTCTSQACCPAGLTYSQTIYEVYSGFANSNADATVLADVITNSDPKAVYCINTGSPAPDPRTGATRAGSSTPSGSIQLKKCKSVPVAPCVQSVVTASGTTAGHLVLPPNEHITVEGGSLQQTIKRLSSSTGAPGSTLTVTGANLANSQLRGHRRCPGDHRPTVRQEADGHGTGDRPDRVGNGDRARWIRHLRLPVHRPARASRAGRLPGLGHRQSECRCQFHDHRDRQLRPQPRGGHSLLDLRHRPGRLRVGHRRSMHQERLSRRTTGDLHGVRYGRDGHGVRPAHRDLSAPRRPRRTPVTVVAPDAVATSTRTSGSHWGPPSEQFTGRPALRTATSSR